METFHSTGKDKINRCEHKAHTPPNAHLERCVSSVPDLDSWIAVKCSCSTIFFLCPYVSDILNLCNQATLEAILLKGVATLNMLCINGGDLLYIGSCYGTYALKKHLNCSISHSEIQCF